MFGLALVLWWSRQIRSLSWIILVHVDCEASTNEVKSYLVICFAFVQSDLDSTFTSANTLEVVLSHLSCNDVLNVGNSLKRLLVEVLWKTFHINVNNFLLGQV